METAAAGLRVGAGHAALADVAGQHAAYGRWAQAGTLFMLALGVPFMAILASAEPILLGIRQDPALSASAAAFSARLVWGVPPFMAFMTSDCAVNAAVVLTISLLYKSVEITIASSRVAIARTVLTS